MDAFYALNVDQQAMVRDLVELAFDRIDRERLANRLAASVPFKISPGGTQVTFPFACTKAPRRSSSASSNAERAPGGFTPTHNPTYKRAHQSRPGKSLMPIGLRGVGKTVLLNRFAGIAEAEGMRVSYMEAPETGDFKYQLTNRLRQILMELDSERRTAKVLRALRILKAFT